MEEGVPSMSDKGVTLAQALFLFEAWMLLAFGQVCLVLQLCQTELSGWLKK